MPHIPFEPVAGIVLRSRRHVRRTNSSRIASGGKSSRSAPNVGSTSALHSQSRYSSAPKACAAMSDSKFGGPSLASLRIMGPVTEAGRALEGRWPMHGSQVDGTRWGRLLDTMAFIEVRDRLFSVPAAGSGIQAGQHGYVRVLDVMNQQFDTDVDPIGGPRANPATRMHGRLRATQATTTPSCTGLYGLAAAPLSGFCVVHGRCWPVRRGPGAEAAGWRTRGIGLTALRAR